jgi:hypothetical protein
MAGILKVKVRWSGFVGGPGYSNFYFRDFADSEPTAQQATDAAARVRTFFNDIRSHFPAAMSWNVLSDVEVIEETTGTMTTVHNITAPLVVLGGAAAAPYSAATGSVVTWRTPGVRNGRRVRGRTFLVPLANNAYDNDGTMGATPLATIQTAANALAAGTGTPDLGIWSRPTGPGAADGAWHAVNAATVPDKVAVLRSRRD